MTTRKTNVPTYAELAKAGAQIRREIDPDDCERLSLLAESISSITAQFEFSWDERGRLQVIGKADANIALACQLCTLPVEVPITVDVSGVIAHSESEAQQWREQDTALNIIVVESPELDEVELVEDELLLRLPSKICVDADCASRPELVYGPEGAPIVTDTHRPFAALAELRQQQESSD